MTTKSFPAYRDVRLVLDTVLREGIFPAEYTLNSPGAAVNWRLRANTLRSDMRRLDKRLNEKPLGESPYDELAFLLEKGSSTVVIDLREPTGTLVLGGKEIAPVEDEPDDEDDFELGGFE